MATYRITAPDGSVFDVTAPDTATEAEVMAYAQQQFAQQQAPRAPARSADDPSLWEGGNVPSLDPTHGQSFLQNTGQGLGKFFADTGRGLGQLTGMVSQEEVDAARLRDAPLNDTWGGIAGQGVGAAATLLGGGMAAAPLGAGRAIAQALPRAAPYVNAAIGGGLLSGAQPVATGETRAGNAAVGAAFGAAGQGIASGLGALAQRAQLPQAVQRSIEAARAAGIPLNVAQTTASVPVRTAQAISKYLPFSGASKSARLQQEAFNRAVGKTFGVENATALTDDVMKAARQRLSAEFDDIYSRNDVAVTPDTVRRLLEIERRAATDMTPDQAGVIRNQIDRVLRAAEDGQMTGQMYQSIRSMLQKAEGQGGFVGSLIRSVRGELDDAAAQSVGPDDAARLARVRGGWANMRTTEDLLRQVGGTTGKGSAAGNVNPAALWSVIRRGSTKEMRELAKIGQNVLKEGIADSGSPGRTLWQGVLTGGAGLGAGAAGGAAALATLGKAMVGGAVAGKALNSNLASKLLQQGRPMSGLARLAQPAPKLLPAYAPMLMRGEDGVLDIGTVHGNP